MNGETEAVWAELRTMNTTMGKMETDIALIRQAQVNLEVNLPCAEREDRLKIVEVWQHDMDVRGRPPSRWAVLMVQLAVQLVVAGALILAAARILKGV